MLPQEIRAQIDEWLHGKAYSDYDGLRDMLAGLGYEISRSALHRYGGKLKETSEEMRKAGFIAAGLYGEMGGDFSKLAIVSQGLLQQKALDLLVEHDFDVEDMSGEDKNALLMSVMKFLPNAAKSQASMEEWAAKRDSVIAEAKRKQVEAEQRLGEIKAKLDALAKDAGNKQSGLDAETLRRVQQELYGLGA
jgi:hypothetical protein